MLITCLKRVDGWPDVQSKMAQLTLVTFPERVEDSCGVQSKDGPTFAGYLSGVIVAAGVLSKKENGPACAGQVSEVEVRRDG